ncbi:MAG: two-component system, NtrC family, sensor kinase [Pseudomonadota bacterium]|nr:two-component system, NtrC family, sensor kinase [Pseudomonadota bacterium]
MTTPETSHMLEPYDREYDLADVLKAAGIERLQQIFSQVIGDHYCIQSVAGEVLMGKAENCAKRAAIYMDMEICGYLCVAAGVNDTLMAALENILKMIVAAQHQYLMISSLHIEAIHADYAALKDRNEKLQESEERYRKLCTELDQRVQEQIAEIEQRQQQLYKAERLASIGHMAAGIAHEINNPMGFILSNLQTASRYVENLKAFSVLMCQPSSIEAARVYWIEQQVAADIEDFPELLRENIQGAERVKSIVSSLMDFSGFNLEESEVCNLDALLRKAADMACAGVDRKIDVQYTLQAAVNVQCNRSNLIRAFFNVLRNAVQAIHDSGEIRIALSVCDAGVSLEITDNGCGMNAQTLEHAFDPFFTTRAVGQGVGLGLTAAREIIQSHGGTILLKSQTGQGTQVSIRLPVTARENS